MSLVVVNPTDEHIYWIVYENPYENQINRSTRKL